MTQTYETNINHVTEGNSKDEYVVIETSEMTVISAFLAKPDHFEIVADDRTPGHPRMVRFRIRVDDVNWGGFAKRKGTARPNLHSTRDLHAVA